MVYVFAKFVFLILFIKLLHEHKKNRPENTSCGDAILTLNDAGGGQNDPLGTDKACVPSIFIKNSQKFFGESC